MKFTIPHGNYIRNILQLENYFLILFFLFSHEFILATPNNNLYTFGALNLTEAISPKISGLRYTHQFLFNKEVELSANLKFNNDFLLRRKNQEGDNSEKKSVSPPIAIKHFVAMTNQYHQIQLVWLTDSEFDNKHFIIEKSSDGLEFFPIGVITSKGNSYQELNYEFTDPIPWTGKNYYRIKGETNNGTISYSSIRKIERIQQNSLKLFSKPTRDMLHIRPGLEVPKDATIEILDNAGSILFKQKLKGSPININIDISHFPNGIYYVQLNANNMRQVSQKLIKG